MTGTVIRTYFVVNSAGSPILYRNDGGNVNHWLRIQTIEEVSNRDSLGALIEVTSDLGGPTLIHEICAGNNFFLG